MSLFVILLSVAVIWAFIINFCKIPTAIINWILRRLFKKIDLDRDEIKPFECSLCMTWWTSLFICYFFFPISIQAIALCAIASFLATLIGLTMIYLRNQLEDWFSRH